MLVSPNAAPVNTSRPLPVLFRVSLNTNRRVNLYERRAALHKRIRDTRCDYHHKATTAIAKSFGVVKVETLNISGLMRNRTVARAFADAGVGEFLRQLEYKCGWYGAEFVKVDRWFPSVAALPPLRPPECHAQAGPTWLVLRWLWCAEPAGPERCLEYPRLQ